jgi:hypothetical protein
VRSFLAILILGFLSSPAVAASGGTNKNLYSTVALSAGIGTTVNKDKTIPQCDMVFGEFVLDGGYKWGIIAPVGQAAFRYLGQTTEASKVNNINMAGWGYLAGAGFALEFSRLSFTAIYDFIGNYDLMKESSGGQKVSYLSPSGFHVNVKYFWNPKIQIVFGMSTIEYKERETAGVKTDISDNPVTQSLYGAGIGYRF